VVENITTKRQWLVNVQSASDGSFVLTVNSALPASIFDAGSGPYSIAVLHHTLSICNGTTTVTVNYVVINIHIQSPPVAQAVIGSATCPPTP
jgi:hypothetical protein